MENSPGFEGFELLRPVEGESRYYVYTRWESEEAFQNWFQSQDFQRGHAQANSEAKAPAPVGTAADLLSFEGCDERGTEGGRSTCGSVFFLSALNSYSGRNPLPSTTGAPPCRGETPCRSRTAHRSRNRAISKLAFACHSSRVGRESVESSLGRATRAKYVWVAPGFTVVPSQRPTTVQVLFDVCLVVAVQHGSREVSREQRQLQPSTADHERFPGNETDPQADNTAGVFIRRCLLSRIDAQFGVGAPKTPGVLEARFNRTSLTAGRC